MSSMWEKLSNSGDSLKLLIPSYSRKAISGWSNYSGKVTSQKILERGMGYRGSKSAICESIAVKEQRVDGSWHKNQKLVFKVYSNGSRKRLSSQNPFLVNNKHVNYTFYKESVPLCLTGINVSSKRNYVTEVNTILAQWVAGFIDAEGCFRISIIKNKNYRGNPWSPSLYKEESDNKTIPLSVRLYFQIGLHIKDEAILNLIKSTIGVGKIYKSKSRPDAIELQVSSFKDMSAVICFFDKYPLITQKWADYLLFKEAYELILNKRHLTIDGLKKLVSLKALINKGLPDQLKEAFPNIEPINKYEIIKDIPDSNWVAGFASGEGCFRVRIFESANHKTGYQVQLRFQITQHNRDKNLMEKLVEYLGCGFISERGDIVDFHVTKFNDVYHKIIPFFEKYQIIGVKLENFNDFCKVANLVNNKEHLTLEGLTKIRELKLKMNTLRDN